jgi:hypothetical protein
VRTTSILAGAADHLPIIAMAGPSTTAAYLYAQVLSFMVPLLPMPGKRKCALENTR